MYSNETRQAALSAVLAGESCMTVAKRTGISHATIKRWYLEAFPERKQQSKRTYITRRGKSHDPEVMEKAWKLRAEGNKQAYIAAVLGVSQATIQDWFCFRARRVANRLYAKRYGFTGAA